MNVLRRTSTGRLVLAALAAALAAVAGVGIAVAAGGGSGSPPPPTSLPAALRSALVAPAPLGVSGTLSFSNHLLGSGALPGTGFSPLLTGATGRFWASGDGKARLELQAPDGSGDVEILDDGSTLELYDVGGSTLYRATLAQPGQPSARPSTHPVPSVDAIRQALDRIAGVLAVAGPTPTTVAGEGAYQVRLSPQGGGGLLGAAELAWDAVHGVPLRLAVYATAGTTPVLELTATHVDFGPVAASDLRLSPPAGVRVIDLGTLGGGSRTHGTANAAPVTGTAAVAAHLPFALVAPDSLTGRQRTEVRLVQGGGSPAALVVYGQGLGAVVALEAAAPAHAAHAGGALGALPAVRLGNGIAAHELVTALGSVVHFDHGGVAYTVAGSQPASTVLDAARALAG